LYFNYTILFVIVEQIGKSRSTSIIGTEDVDQGKLITSETIIENKLSNEDIRNKEDKELKYEIVKVNISPCTNPEIIEDAQKKSHQYSCEKQENNSSVSQSEVKNSESLGKQLSSNCGVANVEIVILDHCTNVADKNSILELAPNCFEIEELCTLLPLTEFDNTRKNRSSIQVIEFKKNNALLQQNKISIADLPRPINFEQEIISSLLGIEETEKIVHKCEYVNNKVHSSTKTSPEKDLRKKKPSVHKLKKLRSKIKRGENDKEFPFLPPLLSLGLYDDIDISVQDFQPNSKYSRPIIKYHEGSLIYGNYEPIHKSSNGNKVDTGTTDPSLFTYKAGKYNDCISDVDKSREGGNYLNRRDFAGMQYAIRRELDKTLQSEEIIKTSDKLNDKLIIIDNNEIPPNDAKFNEVQSIQNISLNTSQCGETRNSKNIESQTNGEINRNDHMPSSDKLTFENNDVHSKCGFERDNDVIIDINNKNKMRNIPNGRQPIQHGMPLVIAAAKQRSDAKVTSHESDSLSRGKYKYVCNKHLAGFGYAYIICKI
jgi:hypothetical protein